MKKLKNLYRLGVDETTYSNAKLNPNWAVLRVISEEDTEQKVGSIILSAGSVEQSTGVLLFQLVNCGDRFREFWKAEKGEAFLLSHLAGDRLGDFVFVESEDVLMKYGLDVYAEE
jgi:hypothetical protein